MAPLKRGRCNVREAAPVTAVPEELIEPALEHVVPQVKAMIQLQMLTGMRPGEVVIMRSCDIDRSGKVWEYRPESHKTEHHGRPRVVYFGPRAQKVLKPWLKADERAYLFSPQEAMEAIRSRRRTNRQTPVTPSQAKRQRRKRPRKAPANCYTTMSYGRAIADACRKAFPPPKALRRKRIRSPSCSRMSRRSTSHSRRGETHRVMMLRRG